MTPEERLREAIVRCKRVADQIDTAITHEAGTLALLAMECRKLKLMTEQLGEDVETSLTTWRKFAQLTGPMEAQPKR